MAGLLTVGDILDEEEKKKHVQGLLGSITPRSTGDRGDQPATMKPVTSFPHVWMGYEAASDPKAPLPIGASYGDLSKLIQSQADANFAGLNDALAGQSAMYYGKPDAGGGSGDSGSGGSSDAYDLDKAIQQMMASSGAVPQVYGENNVYNFLKSNEDVVRDWQAGKNTHTWWQALADADVSKYSDPAYAKGR